MMTLKPLCLRLLIPKPKTSQKLSYQKPVKRPSKYQKAIPEKIKLEMEFMLIVLELLQQLRSLLQSIANTLSTEQLKFLEK